MNELMQSIDKKVLRQELRTQAKRLLTGDVREHWSALICTNIEQMPLFLQSRKVALFMALPDEPDLSFLLNKYFLQKNLYLPRVEGEHEMSFYPYQPDCLEAGGKFDILEPINDASEAIDPKQLDLILVPGLGFDIRGRRLGRGKGFYDCYLAQTSALCVGVAFAFRMVEQIPTSEWDKVMDGIVTEKGYQEVH